MTVWINHPKLLSCCQGDPTAWSMLWYLTQPIVIPAWSFLRYCHIEFSFTFCLNFWMMRQHCGYNAILMLRRVKMKCTRSFSKGLSDPMPSIHIVTWSVCDANILTEAAFTWTITIFSFSRAVFLHHCAAEGDLHQEQIMGPLHPHQNVCHFVLLDRSFLASVWKQHICSISVITG